MSRNIIDVNAGEGALLLNDPIKFTNNVNLNFYYGPYGWKADDGTIPKKYFEYKSGRTTTRYPNADNKNIRPSGMTEEECFEDDGEGNLIYKNSVAYGYALACVLLGKANEAPAGTTFGVANNNNEVIEYTYDGVINNVPMAHVKIDINDLVDETVQQVQSIIPTFIDKEGHTITDLGTYFEQQLGDFIKQDTLDDYTRRDSIFVDGLIDVNKIPTLNAGQIPQLDMDKITGISTEFGKYTEKADLFNSDNKIILDKLPNDVSSKVISLDMSKVNGLTDEFVKYATTSKLLDYTKSSDLFDADKKFKLDIPVDKVTGINAYQTTADLNTKLSVYTKSSDLFNSDNKIILDKLPNDVSSKVISLDMSKVSGLTDEFGKYTAKKDLFDENNTFKIDVPVVKVNGLDNRLSGYATTSSLNTVDGKFANYQTIAGMTNYATTSNVATKDLSNVTEANFASKMVNSGGVTTTSLSRAISESDAIQAPLANEAIEDVAAAIEVEQGDLSLDRLRNIFKNVKIPEIAIQSVKSNTSVYGYAVISNISDGGANMLNSSTLASVPEPTILQKINDVDNAFEGYTGKYIYLIPCIDKKDSLKSWTKTSLSKDVFNTVKSKSDCPYYYYTPNASQIYTKVSSSTNYDDVKNILYYCDENEFLGIFDCYWVDRKTAYEQTVDNAEERVKKLPFVKTIKTTDYIDNGSKETYKTAAFITQYGTYNDSHEIKVTSDSATGDKVYEYIVHEIGDEDSPILSGLTASHLAMYSTSYNIELVTEFHTGKDTTTLLTLDVSGDGLGDLNDEIVEIMDKSTGASVVDFDTSGNTDYYYEVKDAYNANKYTTAAKGNIEDTISWYNTNMWANTSKNVIYLFCYKDAPAKLSNGTDCYGYYFRAIAYMNNSVVPLDWRPCIPYSLSGKQLNYPTIVDLSGTSTTIGLPDGESVSFNSTMTTDDRVNAFLYKNVTTQVPEYSDRIIPGTPEKKAIKTGIGYLDAIEESKKFVNKGIDTTDEKRFGDMKNLAYVDAHMASLIPAFREYVTDKPLLVGAAALILASAILKNSDYKQFAKIYYADASTFYKTKKTEYDSKYFPMYDQIKSMLERDMDYDEITRNFQDIIKAIASAFIGQILNTFGPENSYTLLFVCSQMNKVLKNYALIYWDFWAMIFEGQKLVGDAIKLVTLTSCNIATADSISQLIRVTYKLPEGIKTGTESNIVDAPYSAATPDTTETITTYKSVTVIKPRKVSINGSQGFTYSDYTYTNGTETETGNTGDWFKANTIVRFLVKKTSNKKVYEYRKWNKYTQTWSDLGVEDYVTTEESSGSDSGWIAPYHDPHPVLAATDERIANRNMYEFSNSIAKLQNDVASDISTTNDNIAMMVNRINELTAIINSMTGVSESDRIKALVSTDNKILSISTENGPSVQGLSSAYTTTQDISGASTATDNVDTSVRSTVLVDMDTVKYKQSHQMPILKS